MGASSDINNIIKIKPYNFDEELEENIDFNKIPDDQFLCPECDKVPEILSVHSDNGKIKLKCKNDGIIELSVNEYFHKLKDSKYNYLKTVCCICKHSKDKDDILYYCYDCKKNFCKICIKKCNSNSHHLIKVNEKNNKCLKHYNEELTMFCEDCEENIYK